MRDATGGDPSTIALGSALLRRTRHLAPWRLAIDHRGATTLVLVRRGACRLRAPAARELALSEGDVVLVLGADARLALGADARLELGEGADAPAAPRITELVRVEVAGGATLVPGLVGALPAFVHLRAANDTAAPELAAVVGLIDAELERVAPGRHALLAGLVESLFVYAVRAALAGAASAAPPRDGALLDRLVAKALALVHARPADRWTVERLARATGLSRAAFARRFAAATGVAPLRYATEWRMQLSERLLAETDESIASIAARVGYESEFAFSRAFKRHRGVAPGAFRRAYRASIRRPAPPSTPTRAAA